MKCANCKLQYVGKSETELNLRINNHRREVLKLNTIPADQNFDFNTDAMLIIIEQLQNPRLSKESITELLNRHEKDRIKKLQTFRPKGLNHELN